MSPRSRGLVGEAMNWIVGLVICAVALMHYAEIKAFVRDRLSAYAYPRLIEFTADLPKTLTGKIRRIELREREANVAR